MEKSHEIVSVALGQAGIQTINACWELYCLEHEVTPNGDGPPNSHMMPGINSIYAGTQKGKLVPRTVITDLEPTVIDEIRTGPFRRLFNPSSFLSGKEDAASNFARGYYSVGNEMSEAVMDRIRRQTEMCDVLQGFLLFRSFGGGTGSGLTPNILRKLARDYNKKSRLEVAVYPSPQLSPIIVEPYNAVLTTHSSMQYSDVCFIVDNEAIYDICCNKLDISNPTYSNLNRIIAQAAGGITSSIRFPGAGQTTLTEIQTNLVPFPRLHFPLVTLAPLVPPSKTQFETITVDRLVSSCFSPDHQMVKCDPSRGKYAACCLMFRGDVSPHDVNEAVARIKESRSVTFTDFSPTGFKIGMSPQPRAAVVGSVLAKAERAVVMLSTTSATVSAWERINSKFKIMYNKRAFVHHYVGEGMEEGEFHTAIDDLDSLESDYKSMFR